MQRSQILKLFIQAVIAISLFVNPASGYSTKVTSARPKIQTEWVSTRFVKNGDQKTKARKALKEESNIIPVFVDVTVQLKSNQQHTQAFNKPRTQRQKVPSEDELIA